MPPRRRTALAAVLAALVPAAATPTGGSIRCEGGLVSAGDTKLDLLGKCGRPALVERRAVQRAGTLLGQGLGLVASQEAEATIETWTYDFGPRRFLQEVTVVGGRVARVERGGYGYGLAPEGGGEAPFIPRARCSHLAIGEGDRAYDLLARCGEPASRDVALVTRRVAVLRDGPPRPGAATAGRGPPGAPRRAPPAVVDEVAVTVAVEVWTYDFGPQVLLRVVELEDGVVTRVDTGGHGYSR